MDTNSICAKFAQVQKEGSREVTREIDFYNLDVIISVGYCVKSARGVLFRRWATQKPSSNIWCKVTPSISSVLKKTHSFTLKVTLKLVRKIAKSPEFDTPMEVFS